MHVVTRTRTIARSPEKIWQTLADFGGISAWAPNCDHSCLLRSVDDRTKIGITRRIQTGRMTLLERVVSWDEPKSLAYDIEGLPPIVRLVRNEWRLEATSATTTAVTLTSSIDCGPRPPQRLIARIVGRRLAKASASMLGGLNNSLEERSIA